MPFSAVHKEKSYIGVGAVYLELIGGSKGLQNIGNCSQLELSFEEEKQEQKNFMTPGGGNANVVSSISGFTGSMTLHDYTADNLALALRGEVTAVTAGAVVDEAHSCQGLEGELIPVDFAIDHSVAVTVLKTDDSPLVQDTDFTITSTGIVVIAGSGIDNTGVKISYTKSAGAIMEALVASGEEFRIHFDGLNDAQSGSPVAVALHKVKFSPTSGLNFLGGEFGEIPLEFDVISDSTIVGSGLSQYMRVVQAT
ncbi:hypothetical protein N9J88_03365 [Porticoccaceae bacterium]|nr:hypothetical protein [Porticoccaceae bacterium]